jgi:hypothetical protein
MSASSGSSWNCGLPSYDAPRKSTSNQQCSVHRRCDTSPATVINGDVGNTARCSSAVASPSHFHRTNARCISSQPTNWVRSSATNGGRSRDIVIPADATARTNPPHRN